MSSEELTDEELEHLRRRRLQELQRTHAAEQSKTAVEQQVEQQKQAVLRQILTTEARQRLTNIRMVRPDFAAQVELQLIQFAQSGRVKLPITDDQLKDALSRIQAQRREIKIRRG